MSRRIDRVVPFVEDRRNALVVSFSEEMDRDTKQTFMASIQAALKAAIQIEYQLEDAELAAEPLPSTDDRRRILMYESAEGGAGVLRRVVDDREAIGKIARRALELCHYHPDTAEDLKRSSGSREDCEAACYDCLMNYYNQTDHDKLDRTKIQEFLSKLALSSVKTAPVDSTREEHLKTLARLAGSDLEREWLQKIDQKRLLLPDKAQVYMPEFQSRPDFTYSSKQTVVYIDGPDHDHPDRAARDRNQTADLEDAGYTVVRFGYRENWDIIINKYPGIFGRPS